jgi:hypothetical protein
MRLCRSLLALVVVVCASRAAEIHPLKGDAIKGDVVSVSDTEVVFKQGDKQITQPIKDILKIDFRDVGKPEAAATYAQVELTDGTVLLASKWLIKKREIEMTLLTGQAIKVPLDIVTGVLREAQVDAHRGDWKTRLYNTRGRSAMVVKRDDVISNLECTLGDGDETGQEITIAVTIDDKTETRSRKLSTVHGLIFKHTLDAKAPAASCKLLDTLGDVVMVSGVTPREGGLIVTTPSGAKIDFRIEQISQRDYTKGKLDYLSALDPASVVAKSNLDEPGGPDQWHVYRDTNLNKGPLTLGGVTYSRGLALKPHVELTYDLKGNYRELSVVIGIDDNVSAAGGTTVIFERDGKELASETISSDDKIRHKTLTLNVKDVQRLKIVVKSDGEFDTARHLDLADAKVSK